MPTVIALDVSLSMTRPIPNPGLNSGSVITENTPTYHQVAVQGINCILDHLCKHARLEFVSLVIYSSLYEVVVDFTRDYDSIRQALHKIEHYDKTNVEGVLVAINNAFRTHWGSENYCQIICITDCGVGMGPTSLKNTIINIQNYKAQCVTAAAAVVAAAAAAATTATSTSSAATAAGDNSTTSGKPHPTENQWIGFSYPSKLSFMCLGSLATDSAFRYGTKLYQQLLDVSGQRGQLFLPRLKHEEATDESGLTGDGADGTEEDARTQRHLTRTSALEMFETMCDTNYRQFEATLRCGGYFRLEGPIVVWPAPLPYTARDVLGGETTKLMSRRLEVCGFLALADIGSPMSISRHLILPRNPGGVATVKVSTDVTIKVEHGVDGNTKQRTLSSGGPPAVGSDGIGVAATGVKNGHATLPTPEERLEADIKVFFAKSDTGSNSNSSSASGDHHHHHHHHGQHHHHQQQQQQQHHDDQLEDVNRESVCVLLHGALKVENMAALVLLGEGWYGFIYSYADGKKKSNLMLNVLPPGNDVVPWLGDLRYLGTLEDALPGENPAFPIKAEKRSYSQNIVVWIRQAGLQSDIQKVLRHAKKLPEKTQQFYKELNRLRRAALSLGFVELLEGLAHIFEREMSTLPMSASPDCALQLTHAATELRKQTNRDPKSVIHALPTKYNQLG
ncbi:integrator complex subunit 14 [Anopheles darlingi]|uniref:integrator complex subunit 14 n=1 Tax=Anopheles darlingi TaxID=43151 RepID=UPI0021003B81|nr:integrator complex subunit 14 [Anopheles darlingi]